MAAITLSSHTQNSFEGCELSACGVSLFMGCSTLHCEHLPKGHKRPSKFWSANRADTLCPITTRGQAVPRSLLPLLSYQPRRSYGVTTLFYPPPLCPPLPYPAFLPPDFLPSLPPPALHLRHAPFLPLSLDILPPCPPTVPPQKFPPLPPRPPPCTCFTSILRLSLVLSDRVSACRLIPAAVQRYSEGMPTTCTASMTMRGP